MSRLKAFLLALVLSVVCALGLTAAASAQKVGNPGNFNFKLTNGLMKVKNQEFGFDSSQNINFNGTVNAAGAINIPTITFPNYQMSASGFDLTIKINVVGPTTGTINPLTGAVSLVLKVWIKIDGVPLGGGCRIASSSSPITLNALITGTSGSVTGTGYNPSNGTMKIVNGTYSVPSSSDCGVAGGTVNDTVGLPSASGQNTAVFDITTVPAVTRAINPTFSASPTSGTAPALINFNSAGSTLSSGPASYQWDFQNDGSFDASGATASYTYTTGGTKTVRLRVTDSQGDFAETTRTVSIAAYPDLAISAASDGDFIVGSQGVYRINLLNQGYAATGPVTVKSTLPAGLTFVSGAGTGWNCSATGQDVTCSRSPAVAAGASSPELAITVAAGDEAYDSVDATFTVETSGDSEASNNSSAVTTTVRAADLVAEYEQVPHALVPGDDPGNLIELRARNAGNAATSGTVTITDTLPAGLTPLTATGTGWTCEINGQTVTCTRSDAIAAGAVTDPITVQLEAALEAGSPGAWFEHDVSVHVDNDIDADNDSAAARTLVLDGPDLGLVKSHADDFTAGKQESYSLAVKNFGSQPTTGGATVTDQLPESLEFVSADGGPEWACDEESGTVTCVHAGEIPAGDSAPEIELTVTVGVDAIPSVTNSASVSTGVDPNPDNDESSSDAVVRAIDLTITKSHAGEIRVGTDETFSLAVENVGDSSTIAPTTITDVLPAGLTFVAADGGPQWSCQHITGTVTCDYAGPIAPGEVVPPVDITTEVDPAAAPAVTNQASVSTSSDFNPANDQATDGGDVITVDAAIGIGRTGTFNPGQTGTYLINVENIGAVAATGQIEVETELGQGLTFDSATGNGWSCGETDGLVTCEGHSGLGAHQAAPAIQLRVQVGTGAVPETTTTAKVATADDRFAPNDESSDTASVLGPDLSVTSAHQGSFRVGGNASFELTVTNAGPGPTTGPVTVTGQLPDGFDFIRAQGNGWACANTGQTVTCERDGIIAVGGSAPVITVEAAVTAAALPAGETSAEVDNVVSVQTDSDIAAVNDLFSDPTVIVGTDLAAVLDGPATIGVGGLATYELKVESNGAPNSGPIQARIDLPVGFAPRSFEGDGWNCQQAARRFDCLTEAVLDDGESAPALALQARVGGNAPVSGLVKAKVTAADDVIAGNDQTTVTTATSASPDLKAELSAVTSGDSFVVGSDGGYRAVLRNVGTAPTSGVTTHVILPQGVEFIGFDAASGWDCDSSGNPVTCVRTAEIAPGSAAILSFRVEVESDAGSSVATEFVARAYGDLNEENDSAAADTPVGRVDLGLQRTHQSGWTAGREGTYEVRVTNHGTAATIAPALVTETLPPGTSFRLASGEGWDCSVSGRRLACVGPAAIEPGAGTGFQVTLGLVSGGGSELEASSTVKTVADVDSTNDTATDTITVDPEGPTAAGLPARVKTKKARATQSGLVVLWVNCPSGSGVKCEGRVALRTSGKVKINRTRRAIALGSTRFAVAPGRRAVIRVRLKSQGHKALKRLGSLKTRATVTTKGADTTRRVLLIRRAGR